jgi:zinc transport system substrate-binding protein
VFLYVGGESDAWVEDALEEAVNDKMVVINLMDELGDAVKEEQIVEGMQGEEEEDEEDEEEPENDEHVWLSLKNADKLCGVIAEVLEQEDPVNAKIYKNNAAEYRKKLKALDQEYAAAVSEGAVDTILFGDRFPFRYMTDDYGLNYYAAFVGCSAETEASFETITFLSLKVDELGLHAVLAIEGTDHRIAETVVQNTRTKDQPVLTMDSMQSVTAKDVRDGTTYLSIMERNLSVLKDALR